MKLATFYSGDVQHVGVVDGGQIADITSADPAIATTILPVGDPDAGGYLDCSGFRAF